MIIFRSLARGKNHVFLHSVDPQWIRLFVFLKIVYFQLVKLAINTRLALNSRGLLCLSGAGIKDICHTHSLKLVFKIVCLFTIWLCPCEFKSLCTLGSQKRVLYVPPITLTIPLEPGTHFSQLSFHLPQSCLQEYFHQQACYLDNRIQTLSSRFPSNHS